MIPKVTTEDITGARYFEREGKHYVRVSVEKNGVTAAIRFGWFNTKQEAKDFYKLLKTPDKWKPDN